MRTRVRVGRTMFNAGFGSARVSRPPVLTRPVLRAHIRPFAFRGFVVHDATCAPARTRVHECVHVRVRALCARRTRFASWAKGTGRRRGTGAETLTQHDNFSEFSGGKRGCEHTHNVCMRNWRKPSACVDLW